MTAFFTGCTSEIKITENKDGSVSVYVYGEAGEAFSKMILASTGSNENSVLDTKVISAELEKHGFTNVEVKSKSTRDLAVKITDSKKSSYLFTSKLLQNSDEGINLNITRESLERFYELADEQTKSILDLFLAPIFNDEELSEEEYIETIASVYGDSAANEIKNSELKIILTNKTVLNAVQKIPLSRLLTSGK